MAFDRGRGLIWQVNVGGDNGIYGLDPDDGSVVQVITGSPWGDISQRGLAYDPAADVFYIGGWNEGIVYRVAGPSHATPGETLSQCSPPDPNISGLAWNGSFGLLWEATNSDTDTIWLIDPITCEATRGIPHPDGGGFSGAGIELDVVGNLWTVGQNSLNAYLVESGLPTFSDVPWLTVDSDRRHDRARRHGRHRHHRRHDRARAGRLPGAGRRSRPTTPTTRSCRSR